MEIGCLGVWLYSGKRSELCDASDDEGLLKPVK